MAETNQGSGGYERIVTHNDFDGIVSASVCSRALKVDRVLFAGPITIARSQITITERDVVCDLPYPLQCGLWFDHHEGNLQELELRKIDPKTVAGRFELKASCSRVVYDYFSERIALPAYFLQAVEEADIIDSFSYTSAEEWRRETSGKIIDWTLKVRFPSPEEQAVYLRNLVQQLRDRPIDDVAHLPSVQEHLKAYREEEGKMLKVIENSSYFLDQDELKELVVIDLTGYRKRPHIIKNLAFILYPEALGVLEIYNLMEHGVKSNSLGISISLSIHGNQKDNSKNLGEVMRSLNLGDGHPGAAAGRVRCTSKQEMLKKKREVLNGSYKLWSSQ